LSGQKHFEDLAQLKRNPFLLMNIEKFRFDVLRDSGETRLLEPIHITAALYSLIPRIKLSEDIYIDINSINISSTTPNLINRFLFALGPDEYLNVVVCFRFTKTVSQESNYGTDEYCMSTQVWMVIIKNEYMLFLIVHFFVNKLIRIY
jgi:hypothetical protein